MAKIQILEILPVEAQIEDLSEDMTTSIQGGSILSDIFDIVDETLDEATRILQDILGDIFGSEPD